MIVVNVNRTKIVADTTGVEGLLGIDGMSVQRHLIRKSGFLGPCCLEGDFATVIGVRTAQFPTLIPTNLNITDFSKALATAERNKELLFVPQGDKRIHLHRSAGWHPAGKNSHRG
jgi:hypothetical protein